MPCAWQHFIKLAYLLHQSTPLVQRNVCDSKKKKNLFFCENKNICFSDIFFLDKYDLFFESSETYEKKST